MDHPSSQPASPPILSDIVSTKNPDQDQDEEDESTDADELDEKKRSISQNSKPKKKRIIGLGIKNHSPPKCQVHKCNEDLTQLKHYHQRHRICSSHAKAPFAIIAGIRQRFCQQCSRFHELDEFDDKKRSCRRRLAGHNQRRRKNSSNSSIQFIHNRGL